LNILVHYYRLGHYIGGAEVIALNQCAEFIRLGHSITILTAKTGSHSEIFSEFLQCNPSVKLIELPLDYENKTGDTWTDIDIESFLFGRYAAEHFYANNTEKYDIVVIHNKTDALFIPSRYKTAIHLHGTPDKFDHLMEISLYNADGILAVSESVRQGWTQNVKSLRKDIALIHNGIDTSIFRNNYITRDIDVLFVGRLYPHKGIIELLDAAQTIGGLNMVVIGAGILEDEILQYPSIKHYKNVSTDNLVEFYNRAKIFACPSTSKEGVLTTMLEAAACGCAIITTNCAGMTDFAIDNKNAILVPPSDTDALSVAISKLLTDTKLRENLVENSERESVKNWNIHKQTAKLLDFYHKIICE
jgi:glycosyltransferase involved in cell wall biosynthesis